MEREQLLRSPNYWLAYVQNGLFKMVDNYRFVNRLKKKDLAIKLGVTRGYVSQLLNGDFDHKISKLVELSLACGKVPKITYCDLEQFIKDDLSNEVDTDKNEAVTNIQNILILQSGHAVSFEHSVAQLIQASPFRGLPANSFLLENSDTASISTTHPLFIEK